MTRNQLHKVAAKALQKRLDQMMTRAEQDTLEWYGDSENEREYVWKFRNPADGAITEMVYGFRSKTVTVCGKQSVTVEEWESAWNRYIFRLKRLEELKEMGRYGYQLRMPYMALENARAELMRIDPDFCKRQGI